MQATRPVLVALFLMIAFAIVPPATAATPAKDASATPDPVHRSAYLARSTDAYLMRRATEPAATAASFAKRTGQPTRATSVEPSDAGRAPSGWLATFVVIALIGHQLRRKHRFLRPQRITL